MECRFELTEQPCIHCGKPSGELGTCADLIHCAACRKILIEFEGDDKEAAKTLVHLAEHPLYQEDEDDEPRAP